MTRRVGMLIALAAGVIVMMASLCGETDCNRFPNHPDCDTSETPS